jgi:hypothetical protein
MEAGKHPICDKSPFAVKNLYAQAAPKKRIKKAAFLFALLRDEETPRLHCILFYLMEYSYLSRHTPLILQGFQESPQPVASLPQVAHGIGIGNTHMTFSGFSER